MIFYLGLSQFLEPLISLFLFFFLLCDDSFCFLQLPNLWMPQLKLWQFLKCHQCLHMLQFLEWTWSLFVLILKFYKQASRFLEFLSQGLFLSPANKKETRDFLFLVKKYMRKLFHFFLFGWFCLCVCVYVMFFNANIMAVYLRSCVLYLFSLIFFSMLNEWKNRLFLWAYIQERTVLLPFTIQWNLIITNLEISLCLKSTIDSLMSP